MQNKPTDDWKMLWLSGVELLVFRTDFFPFASLVGVVWSISSFSSMLGFTDTKYTREGIRYISLLWSVGKHHETTMILDGISVSVLPVM